MTGSTTAGCAEECKRLSGCTLFTMNTATLNSGCELKKSATGLNSNVTTGVTSYALDMVSVDSSNLKRVFKCEAGEFKYLNHVFSDQGP